MKIKLLTIGLVSSLSVLMTACDNSPSPEATAKQPASTAPSTSTSSSEYGRNLPDTAPKYVMAVDGASAPFAFKDEKGNLTGFDVDIIRAIGEKQGFRVEVIAAPWNGIFAGLDSNKHDIVGSAVTITPERQQQMNFSNSHLSSATIFATKDPAIQSFADLKDKKVGVQGGSYSEEILKKTGFPVENIVTYKTDFLLYQGMIKGDVAAIIDDSNITKSLNNQLRTLTDTSQVRMLPIPNIANEIVGFAIKKGRNDLTDKINKGLDQIKADGTYDKIYRKWFGTAAPEQAASSTAAVASATTK